MTDLRAEAAAHGWVAQRLTANHGSIQRDFYGRGKIMIKVNYDARGRITDALLYRGPHYQGPSVHLGVADADKRATVLSWIQSPIKKETNV
jgi:hypothetical protein